MIQTMQKHVNNRPSNLSDDGCKALAAAVIMDAMKAYATCIQKEKSGVGYKGIVEREKTICERFFTGNLIKFYSDFFDLNLTGRELMNMIRRDPNKFARRLKESSWQDLL